jgi:hypothetical protein
MGYGKAARVAPAATQPAAGPVTVDNATGAVVNDPIHGRGVGAPTDDVLAAQQAWIDSGGTVESAPRVQAAQGVAAAQPAAPVGWNNGRMSLRDDIPTGFKVGNVNVVSPDFRGATQGINPFAAPGGYVATRQSGTPNLDVTQNGNQRVITNKGVANARNPFINPDTGYQYSSQIKVASPSGNVGDIFPFMQQAGDFIRARGAERGIERERLAYKTALGTAQRGEYAIRAAAEKAASSPFTLNMVGGGQVAIIPKLGGISVDDKGKPTVTRFQEAKPEPTEENIRAMAKRYARQNNPATGKPLTQDEIGRIIRRDYPAAPISDSWLK